MSPKIVRKSCQKIIFYTKNILSCSEYENQSIKVLKRKRETYI